MAKSINGGSWEWSAILLRLALSLVFGYAGLVKMMNPADFAMDVASHRLFSGFWLAMVVYYVPALELVCAVGLWWRTLRLGAGALINLLLVAFALLLGIAWARGLDIRCGCFGGQGDEQLHYMWLLLRDFVLLGVASCLLRYDWLAIGRSASRGAR